MNEQPAVQRTIPVETLTQKIGTLVLQNDFLTDEVNRVSRLYLGLKGELAAEIGRVEADIEKEEEAVKTVAKSVIARIKAKL
jgi:hypothetical protein